MELSNKVMKIKNFFPHKVTGKTDDSFVGFRIKGNEIHFYYPESYRFNLGSQTIRSDIVDLYSSLY